MKVWLDDIRNPPDESWVWAKNVWYVIGLLITGNVEHISFDHDLGWDNTKDDAWNQQNDGYYLAKTIERYAYEDTQNLHTWHLPPLSWDIHSSNPVGRKNIEMAMKSAERFWNTTDENK